MLRVYAHIRMHRLLKTSWLVVRQYLVVYVRQGLAVSGGHMALVALITVLSKAPFLAWSLQNVANALWELNIAILAIDNFEK